MSDGAVDKALARGARNWLSWQQGESEWWEEKED